MSTIGPGRNRSCLGRSRFRCLFKARLHRRTKRRVRIGSRLLLLNSGWIAGLRNGVAALFCWAEPARGAESLLSKLEKRRNERT